MAGSFGFTEDSFAFLTELEANNDREWYNDNKKRFQTTLEAPSVKLLEELSERLSSELVPVRGSKKTMFRMNRDVRFSEDKSPYKTSVSAVLSPSGVKNSAGAIVYIQLDTSGGLSASGVYRLSPKQLGPIRDAIVEHDDAFDEVLCQLKNEKLTLADNHQLINMPRGFEAHADHRHAPVLKRNSLIVTTQLSSKAWISGDVAEHIIAFARGSMPLLSFMTKYVPELRG